MGIRSWYLGQQYLLFNYKQLSMGKLLQYHLKSQKPRKLSPVILSTFTVIPISVQVSITVLCSTSSGIINVKTTVLIPVLENYYAFQV